MNSAVWPLLSWNMDVDFQKVEEDLFPPEMVIGGVSSCALDMHTMQGKKAIKAFHTSLVNKGHQVMKAFAAESEDVVKGLGTGPISVPGAFKIPLKFDVDKPGFVVQTWSRSRREGFFESGSRLRR